MKHLGGANAQPERGLGYHRLSCAFSARFPVGSYLDNDTFDEFLSHSEEVIGYDPKDRGMWAKRIRQAASHPRVNLEGGQTFTLKSNHAGGWRVIGCQEFIDKAFILAELTRFVYSQNEKLRLVAEGVNLENVLGRDQALVRYLQFEMRIQLETINRALLTVGEAAGRVHEANREMTQLVGEIPEEGVEEEPFDARSDRRLGRGTRSTSLKVPATKER